MASATTTTPHFDPRLCVKRERESPPASVSMLTVPMPWHWVRLPATALIRALTEQVPSEHALLLKLHITALRPPASRGQPARGGGAADVIKVSVSEYMSLAKTRLADLGYRYSTATSDSSRLSGAGGGGTEAIVAYMEEHARTGGTVPAAMNQAFFFRRSWWAMCISPVLLSPGESSHLAPPASAPPAFPKST